MVLVLVVKIKEKDSKRQGCIEYKNEIELENFKKLALFLMDLETYGGRVEKAFQEFQKKRAEGFPW